MKALFLSFLVITASQAKPLAIRTERVVTVTGGVVENGVILIEDGKIVKIAPRLEIPLDARVVDAEKLTAYPGLVLAATTLGVDYAAGGDETASVERGFWPFNPAYERVVRTGITAMGLVPRQTGLFPGQGIVVRPLSRPKRKIVLRKSNFLCANFSSSYARSFVSFLKRKSGVGALVASGKLPVAISVPNATSLLRLARILSSFRNVKKSIRPGRDVVNAVPTLLRLKSPCLLAAASFYKPGTAYEVNVAALLEKGKVPICLLPLADRVEAIESFRLDVARLIGLGLGEETALRAVTIVPAQIMGVDWRIGSLEKGKSADIVLFDGDIFDPKSRLESVYVEGERVFPASLDRKKGRSR